VRLPDVDPDDLFGYREASSMLEAPQSSRGRLA
jgi:hypothetical protein